MISKTERAVQEVITGRQYISELEQSLKATEDQLTELEKAVSLDKAAIKAKTAEVKELRESIAALKAANAERVKEIGKLQKQLNDEKAKTRFWRKIALGAGTVLAAGAAAVVLLN